MALKYTAAALALVGPMFLVGCKDDDENTSCEGWDGFIKAVPEGSADDKKACQECLADNVDPGPTTACTDTELGTDACTTIWTAYSNVDATNKGLVDAGLKECGYEVDFDVLCAARGTAGGLCTATNTASGALVNPYTCKVDGSNCVAV